MKRRREGKINSRRNCPRTTGALIHDSEVFQRDSLIIMRRMLDIGGEAACIQLSEKYGESWNYYSRGSSALAQRVARKVNCPLANPEDFSGEHMERLYERFILEYYRQHHPQLKASASQVPWALDENADAASACFLPTMQTDIMLRCGERTLIIDAKYYGRTMQTYYDRHRVHSANLYQIFTYVKNQEAAQTGSVSGMLLYAKTEETIVPDFTLGITGNQISVKTLDLNKPFALVARQLDKIAQKSFCV